MPLFDKFRSEKSEKHGNPGHEDEYAGTAPPAYGDASLDVAPPHAHRASPVPFPLSFGVFSRSVMSMHIFLGQDKHSPQMNIELHSGLTKKPFIIIHSGEQDSSPVIGTAKYKGWSGRHLVIGMPQFDVEEALEYETANWSRRYIFGVEVGPRGSGRRERFEWRPTTEGSAWGGLQGWSNGLKLIRMDSGPGSSRQDGPPTLNSSKTDGREAVAYFANAPDKPSMTHLGQFEFRNSGATGELGDMWATIAITSAIAIWWKERNEKMASSSSSSSAIATVVT